MSRFGGRRYQRAPTPPAPPVGPQVFQQSAKQLEGGGTATSFTKTNVFPSTPTPGRSAVMVLSTFNAPAGITQTVTIGGETAVVALEHERNSGVRLAVLYVPLFGATPNRNVVIGYSGAAAYKYHTFAVLECSPLAASPVDLAQYLLWYDDMDGGWPIDLTAAAPTAQANELLVGAVIAGTGMADCLINSPATPGATSLFHEVDSDSYQGGEASFKILDTIQTPTMSWSKRAGSTGNHWDSAFVTFKFA